MNLPMETVMRLPVQDRRYYIMKHNHEQEDRRERNERNGKSSVYDGSAINEYARMEQENIKNRTKGGV